MAAAAAVPLAFAGCADPHFRDTKLKPLSAVEKTMECQQIDLAIDRADTVRWVLRHGGARLESTEERSMRQAANVVLPALFLLSLGIIPPHMPEPGHSVLNAADGRIRELLQLKRSRGCPSRATTLAGISDMALVSQLDALHAELDAKTGDEDALLKERARLLDGLRIVPPPAAAKRRQTSDRPDKQD